ncbi:MAG TPA: TldD/PmbA family protein [Deltaproteobacteria bacterium]|nr:TldD/PmbA family protein [Candidatus Lambdaproteobacteria bacterium]HIN47042.1 TldD/PmbA family protein [Deltaproteobacteria bacterium]HIO84352.1 TldD/PmbA family protein [Deltaproteobacteria bacterium]
MLEKHKTIAKDIIELAQKYGAEQVSVSLANSTSFQVDVREKKIESLQESGSSGIHLTVSKNKRRSTVSSNDLRIETLAPLILSTLQALPFMGEDEFYSLPDPKLQGRAPGNLEFLDPDFDKLCSEEKIKIALDLEQLSLKSDKRLRTDQSFYSDNISYMVHADSNGFLEGETKTLFSLGVSMIADDTESTTNVTSNSTNVGRKQTDGWYSAARFHKNLTPSQEIVDQACRRTLRKLGAIKPASQEVPVVFSSEMAQSFLGKIASALMGENLFRKQSFLLNKLNESIADSKINLIDDPLLPGKLGSRHFDSEGVEAKPLVLIENGVLKNYMLSTYSANKLGMISNGHSGGISNLILKLGDYPEEELIASVKNGLYLTFMSGQGANIVTGDFSRGAQGIWIRDGKLTEPVSEFTIAGTFSEMLMNLRMIGSEVDERSSILTPAFKIDKMAVSGN